MTLAEQFSNPDAVLAALARAMANLVPAPSTKPPVRAEKNMRAGGDGIVAAAGNNLALDPKRS